MVREREEQLAMCAEEHETREGLLCGEITHRDEHIGALRDEVQMLLGRVDELDHQNREMDAYQRGELEVSITTFRPPPLFAGGCILWALAHFLTLFAFLL